MLLVQMCAEPDPEVGITRASRLWWIFLARGVAGLLLGVSVLLGSGRTSKLADFIALYWLVGAVLTIRWVFANRGQPGSRLALAAAVAGIFTAALVLVRHIMEGSISPRFAVVVLGIAALLTGLLRLFGAFHDEDASMGSRRRWKRFALGSLEVVLGALLVVAHDLTRPLIVIIGAWGIIGGTVLLLDALQLRAVGRSPRR